jgi:ribosomal protein S18 acetylase RimI-like enzyme
MMLLYEMEVLASYRRKGIGRRLVGAFREHAIAAGCQSMWLITDDDNVNAQMLYQLEGATTEGARLQFSWRNLPQKSE